MRLLWFVLVYAVIFGVAQLILLSDWPPAGWIGSGLTFLGLLVATSAAFQHRTMAEAPGWRLVRRLKVR